jgi:carboxyl-terminal processing protease
MKRNYKILLVVVTLSVALGSFMPKQKASTDPEKDKLLLELLTFVIEKGHYNPAAIDDTFSKGVYKDYLNALDPSKRFFLQSDIDEFVKFETELDDQIKNKDLTFFDLTYSRLMQRMEECKSYYKEALANPFDYKKDESFNTDYEKMPFAKTTEELKDRWRLQVKLSALSSLVEKQKLQEDLAKDATKTIEEKLADYRKDSSDEVTPEMEKKFREDDAKRRTEKPKTYAEIEKSTREATLNSLNDNFSFIKDLDREDWFSIYVNAIASRFDPHTSYFGPAEKEKFDVSMSGKLEGIGARLQKKGDFTEISEYLFKIKICF